MRKNIFFKLFSFCIFLCFLSSFYVFAFNIFEDDNFKFFTNKKNPKIILNLSCGSEKIFVDSANLFYKNSSNLKNITYKINDSLKEIFVFNSRVFNFNIDFDISKLENLHFKTNVFNKNNKKVIPKGDPIDFLIFFDDKKPKFLEYKNYILDKKKIELFFDKNIYYLELYINGEFVKNISNIKNFELINKKKVVIDFEDLNYNFTKEYNNFEFKYFDLAENFNESNFSLFYSLSDLKINLQTLKENNNLEYNYNKSFLDLFNQTIYSKKDQFTIEFKTNKEAVCYYSFDLINFEVFDKTNSKKKILSSDNILHKINIDLKDSDKKGILLWVSCYNKYKKSQIVYLNDFLGFKNKLIRVKKYLGSNLEILFNEPNSIITNVPFSSFVKTNNLARCFFKFNNNNFLNFSTNDFVNHNKNDLDLSLGNHKILFKCFDVLNNKVEVLRNVEVNPDLGIKVTNYKPKYSDSSSVDLEIVLSQAKDVECRYSLNKKKSKLDFLSLEKIESDLIVRNFKVSNLIENKNHLYIYCKKDSIITENDIKIIYDLKGITLSNFSFVNNNYFSKNYISSKKEFTISFNVDSLIPIKYYVLEVFYKNSSLKNLNLSFKDSDKEKIKKKFKDDFEDVEKVVLKAFNELNSSFSLSQNIKYDLSAPIVSLSNDKKKIICSDFESGCSDIFYGLAKTSFNCNANIKYNLSSNLEFKDFNYVCVSAFDNAGLNTKFFELVNDNFNSNNESDSGFDSDDDLEDEEDQVEEESDNDGENQENNLEDEEDEIEEEDPLNYNESEDIDEDGKTGYVVILALAFFLAGVSGGSFYVYKKGYLNSELERLGILKKREKVDKDLSNFNNFNNVDFKNKKENGKKFDNDKNLDLNHSNYDKHLKKLNDFIDSKIQKDDDLFSKFDVKDKKKKPIKNFKETLIKKPVKKDLTKEEFDEFYSSSKKDKNYNLSDKKSLEQEAESFEEFYKKRKSKKK